MNSGLSPNFEKYSEPVAAEPLSIALIGPDSEQRNELANSLAKWPGAQVREFPAYPPNLDDVPRMLCLAFDVIVIDLDSNPDYALQVVESICSQDPAAVMVYSGTSSQEQMARCRHAGAREYLEAPFGESSVHEALARITAFEQHRKQAARDAGGKLLVFFGAKGGAGTTTIACNYAVALAQESRQRTLLIDLALPLGDAALNLGIAGEHSTEDALKNAEQLDPSLIEAIVVRHASGVSVLAAPSKVSDIAHSTASIEKLISVARGIFEFVIVDLGSRVDLMNTALTRDASTIYMVTQAGISELRNAERLISRYFHGGDKKLEIVINRFSAHASRVTEDQMAGTLGRPVRWKVPDDYDAMRLAHNPETQLSQSDSEFSRTLVQMAGSVTLHPVYPERNGPTSRSAAPPSDDQSLYSDQQSFKTESGSTESGSSNGGGGRTGPPKGPGGLANVIWESPESIVFGTPLSEAQLNAKAAIGGTFIYTPGPGYVLPVGTHTLWVTFTPETGAMVQAAASITVSKAMPELRWPVPRPISCDTPLSDVQLNAIAFVPGEFDYSPAAGKVLDAGEHTLTLTFTPTDSKNLSAVKAQVAITVEKLRPTIEWPTPERINCGGALSEKHLNAKASVAGVFTYSPGRGEVLDPGVHTVSAVFTPADTSRYETVQATIKVTVKKAPPRVTWAEPDPIVYGTPLSTAQLNATATVEGSFVYTPGLGAVLSVGEHTPFVTFRPIDDEDYADYPSIQAAVPLSVVMARPVISWAKPSPISSGTPLSANELNATAPIPGTFVYKPALGETLGAGEHTLSVTFTPADTMNYEPVKSAVSLTVIELNPAKITWPAPAPIPYGTALGEIQLNASAAVPGIFAYGPGAGNVLPPGRHTLSAIFTPEDRRTYTVSSANVTLEIEALPDIAPLLTATMHKAVEQRAAANPLIVEPVEREVPGPASVPADFELAVAKARHQSVVAQRVAAKQVMQTNEPPIRRPEPVASAPKPERPRETRTYKGVVYEKGDDGQWHRQQN